MSDVIERKVVKQEDYVVTYSDGTIVVKEVRLSFPHLDKPWAGPNGTNQRPTYGAIGLMPKSPKYRRSYLLLEAEIQQFALSKQNPDLPTMHRFMRDGDERKDRKGFPGHWSIHANETNPPALRGRGTDPVTGRARIIKPENAVEVFYPGCWVNLFIKPWWQSNTNGKKINANLRAIQFVRDGERIVGDGRITDDVVDDTLEVLAEDDSGFDDLDGL